MDRKFFSTAANVSSVHYWKLRRAQKRSITKALLLRLQATKLSCIHADTFRVTLQQVIGEEKLAAFFAQHCHLVPG